MACRLRQSSRNAKKAPVARRGPFLCLSRDQFSRLFGCFAFGMIDTPVLPCERDAAWNVSQRCQPFSQMVESFRRGALLAAVHKLVTVTGYVLACFASRFDPRSEEHTSELQSQSNL